MASLFSSPWTSLCPEEFSYLNHDLGRTALALVFRAVQVRAGFARLWEGWHLKAALLLTLF